MSSEIPEDTCNSVVGINTPNVKNRTPKFIAQAIAGTEAMATASCDTKCWNYWGKCSFPQLTKALKSGYG
jgi:hypothetical protein